MLAKALASQSLAAFLNINCSSLMHKYLGDSEKAVAALFSLARKLSPTIIFLDEIDAFLYRRGEYVTRCT